MAHLSRRNFPHWFEIMENCSSSAFRKIHTNSCAHGIIEIRCRWQKLVIELSPVCLSEQYKKTYKITVWPWLITTPVTLYLVISPNVDTANYWEPRRKGLSPWLRKHIEGQKGLKEHDGFLGICGPLQLRCLSSPGGTPTWGPHFSISVKCARRLNNLGKIYLRLGYLYILLLKSFIIN